MSSAATGATIAVLAKSDGSGGVPVTFDGYGVKVTDPVTTDTETLPLFASHTSSATLEVVVDRCVVAVFANGKMLHKVVNPPRQDSTNYASGVALKAAGGSVGFAEFSANSLR